ncbi:hypothetical protein CHLRE_08g380550v5 [Chlamydomonas reinhardtii]|uniref:Uncharacterized protein n=1 Tax=Chlamydomonas reinhardtii TaxID=3055 RepID=A0A2K3DI06_CHLRE|nr:uncharacterized protein CHLRE_08g380550v5 [Chlamydomonas reinhardtii]PNW80161.1 hypothetical protein CHLRE_08g380550v5 [Chlamydomonas reinhardtii]
MASAASPPASFNLPASGTTTTTTTGSSTGTAYTALGSSIADLTQWLLSLPAGVARALLSPGSGEGLLGLLPGWARQLLPGWDPDRDMTDMFGKVVMITGANSGIGFQATRLLARNNAHVVMVVRDEDKGRKAAEDIKRDIPHAKLTLMQADMASLSSVKRLAEEFTATGSPLHVLVNNAGGMAPGPFAVTADGFETTLATHYYAPLYLTLLLLPRLRASAPSRVVNVASFGEAFGRVHWDDLRLWDVQQQRHRSSVRPQLFEDASTRGLSAKRGVDLRTSGLPAYAASKLYLLMASRDLNRRLRGTGVDVFPVHPGLVSTPGEAKSDKSYPVSVLAFVGSRLHGQSELRGALAPLFAATEPRLQGRGGTYIGPNSFGLQLFGWGGSNTVARSPVNWAARDAAECRRLYDQTRAVLDSATVAAGLGAVPVTHFVDAQQQAAAKALAPEGGGQHPKHQPPPGSAMPLL